MNQEGKTPADVMSYHRVISAALTSGEKRDDSIRNVAKRAARLRVPRPATNTPTPERVLVLIEPAERSKSPWMAQVIRWAVLTGMRRGQICGLRWPSITGSRPRRGIGVRVAIEPARPARRTRARFAVSS